MGTVAGRWLKRVDPHFGFVREHGFNAVETGIGGDFGMSEWVSYCSKRSAIRVSRNGDTRRIEVELARLENGRFRRYLIDWSTHEPRSVVLLDSVVEVRRPDLLPDVKKMMSLGDSDLEVQLRFLAQVLRDVAADFLEGGLAPLVEVGSLQRSWASNNSRRHQPWLADNPSGSKEED